MISCPKTTKFGPKLAFLVNLGQAMQAYSMPCCGSVGGCGARAVSRKTPIYFIVVTMNRQSSKRIVAGGESSVGEDGGVDPGQEVGDAGVHVRDVLWKEYLNKNLCWLFLTLI